MLCAIGVHAQKLKINTVPEGLQKAYLDGKDTVPIVNLREIYIYPQVKFKNKREQARYKLTFSQGKLLIKLIDRECNQSSYNLLKAYLGSFRAGFWNIFAGMFGASLKTEYDPKGKDAMTERVVVLVENGLI